MKSRSINTSILLTTSFVIGLFAAAVTLHQSNARINEANANHIQHIKALTLSSVAELKRNAHLSAPEAERLARNLQSLAPLNSVMLVNSKKQLIFHAGNSHTPKVEPVKFPQEGDRWYEIGTKTVLIQAIPASNGATSKRVQYWLMVESDRQALQDQKLDIVQTAVAYVLIAMICAFFVARMLGLKVLALLSNIDDSFDQISGGALKITLADEGISEAQALADKLNALAKKLSNYRSDMRDEIEQTTDDLRETLETIEAQNVELDIARKEAVLATKAKSQFLANMSHEIRTPLNGIIGFTNLMLRTPLNRSQQDHLSAIKKSSEVLLLIINDILDFSKVEAGQLVLENQAICLEEVLEDVVSMLAPTAHEKGLELCYLYYKDVPSHIHGDALRIKQIISNLVNNAIKFTEEGEIIIRAMLDDELSEHPSEDSLKISITDTGVGLTRQEQRSIFKAFSQADISTARQYGGTGLGLSISKALVGEMKGRIQFKSTKKVGSEFWFTLPITPVLESEDRDTTEFSAHIRALVYEPSKASKLSIQHILQGLGIDFECVESIDQLTAATELERIQSSETEHLVLLSLSRIEIEEPSHAGLVRRMRDCGWRVIVLSPNLERYNTQVLQEASAHIIKPMTRTSFSHTVQDLLSTEPARQTVLDSPAAQKLSSPHTVLAVDDNELNLALIHALIGDLGIKVELVNNGAEAIEKCRTQHYPLILMDIQMPEMDGVQCLQEIRQLSSYHSHGNIIALTAYALPKEKAQFIEQGFQSLITKPVNEDKLIDILCRFLPDCESRHPVKPSVSTHAPASVTDPEMESLVDWEESIALCNGNKELANELHGKLIEQLITDQETIQKEHKAQDFPAMESCIHALHGACHYVGVPRLRQAAMHAEHQLKVAPSNATDAVMHLLDEIALLLSESSRIDTSLSKRDEA